MPAPAFLSGLPKPLLFGLYGALSGFAAALVLAEPAYAVLTSLEPANAAIARRIVFLLLVTATWSALIVAPICLGLLIGQHHYLKSQLADANLLAIGLLGGTAVGVVGGIAGQVFFFIAPLHNFLLVCMIRIFSWAILGGLSGLGLSFFIPNMKKALALAGGATGGAVGCVGFILTTIITARLLGTVGETLGRVVGGMLLGLGIGLMVAAAETMFRRAWLEVTYGSRETITVSLGPEPVKVGSDARACTVWARGAEAIALRFFIRDGQVICDDLVEDVEIVAFDGYTHEVGNVAVKVRIDDGSGRPQRKRRSRSTAQRGRSQAKPVSRDAEETPRTEAPPVFEPAEAIPPAFPTIPAEVIDDDFDLPMPLPKSTVSAPTPQPVPLLPAEVIDEEPELPVPVVPPPSLPAAASPPSVPAKPPAKDPDACPSCGRKAPGRKGTRYCVVCDQMY